MLPDCQDSQSRDDMFPNGEVVAQARHPFHGTGANGGLEGDPPETRVNKALLRENGG